MTTFVNHSFFMTQRHLRALVRQPWYIAFTLMQPIIYLVLFGALFKAVVQIPGFQGGSYLTFLTPGIVVMSALFGAGWAGMGMITDLDRGVIDRFLVSPASRGALIAGRLVQIALVTIVQTLIIIGLGLLLGARFEGGILGVLVLIAASVLLAVPIGALSSGLGLLMRKEESMIGAINFVLLPLTFLSSVFMQQSLAPHWIQSIARYNPVNWSVQVARGALGASPDWSYIGLHLIYLATLTVICAWLSVRAFKNYQRSV
jgi:ABC-2 type transport system permease protein